MYFDMGSAVMCLIGFVAQPLVVLFLSFLLFQWTRSFSSIYRFVALHLVEVLFLSFHRVRCLLSCFAFYTLMRNRLRKQKQRHSSEKDIWCRFSDQFLFSSRSIIWLKFLCVFRERWRRNATREFCFFLNIIWNSNFILPKKKV